MVARDSGFGIRTLTFDTRWDKTRGPVQSAILNRQWAIDLHILYGSPEDFRQVREARKLTMTSTKQAWREF
jgi:hypothetical protein